MVGTVHMAKNDGLLSCIIMYGHYVLNSYVIPNKRLADASNIAAEQQYLQKTFAYQENQK